MAADFYLVEPGGRFMGEACVPGDKSISHRALILGAIADGESRIKGILSSQDTLATRNVLGQMGVSINVVSDTEIRIKGVGLYGLRQAGTTLDLGNSGTSVRLLAGLLCGQSFASRLSGDASLHRRPMQRIIEPLTRMGAKLMGERRDGNTVLPLHIEPVTGLRGIDYRLPVASAQVKSCLLLAGLYAEGSTCITEPGATRDHTERMLALFSHAVTQRGNRLCSGRAERLFPTEIDVPADLSSAAFFMVGACIAKGSVLMLRNVGINPTRSAVLTILQKMGANIAIKNQRTVSNEPRADLLIRGERLHGLTIPVALVPSAIDEFPALMIAAACAQGKTVLAGAAELRVKESDRIQALVEGLCALGIEAVQTGDGMIVEGGTIQGGEVQSFGDHRIAMAFAIAGMVAKAPVRIHNCQNVETSFPGFIHHAAAIGLNIC